MGAAAISGLLIKRHYEYPKRTWIVWSYDVGKQVLGSLGIHFLNLSLSIIKGNTFKRIFVVYQWPNYNDGSRDECDWYFLNLLMDTTIGIPILWCCLTLVHMVLVYFNVKNIESGNYSPEIQGETFNTTTYLIHPKRRKPVFKAFFKQLIVFMSGLIMMKGFIFIILNYFELFARWFADLVLGWSDKWPTLQIFLVMFVFPVCLNCFQYFCIDSIIKLPSNHLNIHNIDNFDQNSIMDHDNIISVNYRHKIFSEFS